MKVIILDVFLRKLFIIMQNSQLKCRSEVKTISDSEDKRLNIKGITVYLYNKIEGVV